MDINDLDKLISYLYTNAQIRLTESHILNKIYQDNPSIPISSIILHVYNDGYLNRWTNPTEDGRPIPSKDEYSISIKGILAHQQASYIDQGLYQSIKLKEQAEHEIDSQIKKNTLANTTSERKMKKYWWLLLILGWLGGLFTDMAKDYLKRKFSSDTIQTEKKDLKKSNKSDGNLIK